MDQVSGSRPEALKTGTDDKPVGPTENGQEKLTPKWTPSLTPTAFSGCNGSSTIGNEQGKYQEEYSGDNYSDDKQLDNEDDRLATAGVGENDNGQGRIRTCEDLRQRVYSPSPLASRAPTLKKPSTETSLLL